MAGDRAICRARPGDARAAWLVNVAAEREGFDGLDVLQECDDAASLLLWQGLRDVVLWGTTTPVDRGSLFGPCAYASLVGIRASAEVDPPLQVPLACLCDLVASPANTDPGLLEIACLAIAKWAVATQRIRTALHFAEAAALVCPRSPAAAAEAGELALRLGRHQRAQVWLRLAAGLSRRSCAWSVHGAARLSLGRLYALRGDHTAGRGSLLVGLRVARRHKLDRLRGRIALELFRVCRMNADYRGAMRYSRMAQRFLHPGGAAVRELRREIAEFWIETGEPCRAVRLLQGAAVARHPVEDRIACMVLLVQAAAAAQDLVAMDTAWDNATSLIRVHGETDATARQLLSLAEAAAGHIEQCRVAAVTHQAAGAARRRGDEATASAAAAFLRSIEDGRSGRITA
ncbi:MAG: hypothetical protein ABW277_23080 [Longimicrobiaceae bacterium]